MHDGSSLKERLANLEALQGLMIDALLHLIGAIKPDHRSFALIALTTGLTAREIDAIHEWLG